MGTLTAISWTDHTFNPWWGCQRVSPGCEHCYAEAFAKRTGHDVWGMTSERRFFGGKHWNEPLRWDRAAEAAGERRRVFCASMADVFEDRRDLDGERVRLFDLIEATPCLTWQLLTKRPENVANLIPELWRRGDWPPNVWLGTTVEDQRRAEERIPRLLEYPAAVRFLSCEPLLGRVWLPWLTITGASSAGPWQDAEGRTRRVDGSGRRLPLGVGGQAITSIPSGDIHWVIVGGESGPKHRPLDLDAARFLRDQCQAADVPFFFKQVGGRTPTAGGDLLDGVTWKQFPVAA